MVTFASSDIFPLNIERMQMGALPPSAALLHPNCVSPAVKVHWQMRWTNGRRGRYGQVTTHLH